jgi:hypothetical protein
MRVIVLFCPFPYLDDVLLKSQKQLTTPKSQIQ